VARNVRADRVEIDLIARRGPLLIFVEVKARRSTRFGVASEAVDARKQRRLRRGARAWLASSPTAARGARRFRFDVITCTMPEAADRSAVDAAPPADTPGSKKEATVPERTQWQIEHWEAAF